MNLFESNDIVFFIIVAVLVISLIIGYFTIKYIKTLSAKVDFLYKYNDELYNLFNRSRDGIAICNIRGDFLVFNDRLSLMTNLSKKKLYSLNIYKIIASEDIHLLKEKIENIFDEKEVTNLVLKLNVKNNPHIYTDLSIAFLDDKKRLLISIRDIDKIIKNHEEMFAIQSRLTTIGEMVGSVGHQWKQPLSIISALLLNIRIDNTIGTLSDDNLTSYLDQVDDQIGYMSSTLDDFKNFITSKDIIEKFNIKDILNKVMKISQKSFDDHNIIVVCNVDKSLFIRNSHQALMQVLMNILANAKDQLIEKKVIEDRFIFIDLSKEKDHIALRIYDNGDGIEESLVDKVFMMNVSTKKDKEGSGLGLYMTKKLIENNMKSSIKVFNKNFDYNGKKYNGACFYISLRDI